MLKYDKGYWEKENWEYKILFYSLYGLLEPRSRGYPQSLARFCKPCPQTRAGKTIQKSYSHKTV